MNKIEIAPLEIEQIDELLHLYDTFDRPKDDPISHGLAAEVLSRIRTQQGEVYVALDSGNIVGTYAIYICQNLSRSGKPFAVIENVVCAPEYRRQGIGSTLMKHAQSYAKNMGCYKVMLQTGGARKENHAFYESCGFSFDKRGYQVRFDG